MNGNLETEEYAEGIYVGYRYFDSFGIEPLFSFGYGLSYTEFDIRLCGINTASKGVTVTVEVENTGTTYSGKEVVQIYASLPQDGSRKEFRRLVGYEKTEELKAFWKSSRSGESRQVLMEYGLETACQRQNFQRG